MWKHRAKRFLLVGLVAFMILTGVQMLKGHSLAAAARFAGIWGAVSATIFVATGIYYAKRSIDCPICNDPIGPPPPQGG